jgi:hypothetical protein
MVEPHTGKEGASFHFAEFAFGAQPVFLLQGKYKINTE